MGRVDGEVGLCGNEAKPTCRVLEIGAETGGRVAGTLPAPTIITFGMTYVGWLLVGSISDRLDIGNIGMERMERRRRGEEEREEEEEGEEEEEVNK